MLALRARGSVKEEACAFACLHRASLPKEDLTVKRVVGSLSSLRERGEAARSPPMPVNEGCLEES